MTPKSDAMKSLLPPKYTPPNGEPSPLDLEIQRWGKRILTMVAVFGAIGTGLSVAGWKSFGPGPRITAVEAQTDTNIRDIASLKKENAELRRDVQSSIYIGCELLKIQQPGAVQLQECRDAQQRRNGPP
jgi:hypothetical protein